MKKIKFGIFGLGRGSAFYNSIRVNNGEIVAICDMNEAKLEAAKQAIGEGVTTYTDFDKFLSHEGLEAVFLCNFFHEHAPYAIKALERNIHVLSECTSNGTMAEGVALVRAAEKSKALYMLSENYPFMRFNQEMYRVYREGTLGKALFAEGEYNHPLDIADVEHIKKYRPFPTHWRNYTPRTYYITHSLAPLMYITYPGSALGGISFYSYKVVQTFVFHGLVFAWGVLSLTTGFSRLEFKKIWKELIGLVIIALWAAFGNAAYSHEGHHFDWFFITGSTFPFVPTWLMPFAVITAVFGMCAIIFSIDLLVKKQIAKKIAVKEN